jgi:hypothetical protein
MNIETTPYGNFNNSQSFTIAFNIADQPIDSDEKKEKFLELIKDFESYQINQLFIDCNHVDAAKILLDKYPHISDKHQTISHAITIARKKKLESKKQYLLDIFNNVNNKDYKDYKDYIAGCLITNAVFNIYIDVYDKLLKFLEFYHQTIDSHIRSSYWHDHKFKYPFEKIKVYMVTTCDSDILEISLVTPLNETYTGPREFLANPYICNEIYENPNEIIYQELVVYQLAKYSFIDNNWYIKYTTMDENYVKYIKCVKCRKVINEISTIPFSKQIHKFISSTKEKCQNCLKLEPDQINPEDYYCDWSPALNEKWHISGSSFLFTLEEGYPPEILKTAQQKEISNFIVKNIVNPVATKIIEIDGAHISAQFEQF